MLSASTEECPLRRVLCANRSRHATEREGRGAYLGGPLGRSRMARRSLWCCAWHIWKEYACWEHWNPLELQEIIVANGCPSPMRQILHAIAPYVRHSIPPTRRLQFQRFTCTWTSLNFLSKTYFESAHVIVYLVKRVHAHHLQHEMRHGIHCYFWAYVIASFLGEIKIFECSIQMH